MIKVGDVVYKDNPEVGTTWTNMCRKRGIDPFGGYVVTAVEFNYSGNRYLNNKLDPQNPVLLSLQGFSRRMSASRFSARLGGIHLEDLL